MNTIGNETGVNIFISTQIVSNFLTRDNGMNITSDSRKLETDNYRWSEKIVINSFGSIHCPRASLLDRTNFVQREWKRKRRGRTEKNEKSGSGSERSYREGTVSFSRGCRSLKGPQKGRSEAAVRSSFVSARRETDGSRKIDRPVS